MPQMRYFRMSENVQAGYWYLGEPLNKQGQEVAPRICSGRDGPSATRAA